MNNTMEERFDEKFPVLHDYCEDSWYSCPKAPDGCSNEDRGDDCFCGAEEYYDEIKQFIRQELKQARIDVATKLEKCVEFSCNKEGTYKPYQPYKSTRDAIIEVRRIINQLKENLNE